MSPNPNPQGFTLKQAAAFLKIDEHTMRQLHMKHKVRGVLTPHPTLPNVSRLMFTQPQLDKYAANRKQGVGARADGRNKFIYYATPDELARANKALIAAGLPALTKAPTHKSVKKPTTPQPAAKAI